MKSNLHKILNGDTTDLTSRDIDKKVNYGSVVIKNLPKDSIIIIDGNDIQIVKEDKTVSVDGKLLFSTNHNEGSLVGPILEEGIVSFSQLKLALETAVDSYGAPIQYIVNPLDELLICYDNIKIEQR